VPDATTVEATPQDATARRRSADAVPAVLAAGAVLAQVAYPLLDGPGRASAALTGATIAAVLLFCAASVAHAGLTLGPRAAATLVAVAGGAGLLAESVGVSTGYPFGEYAYAGTLGPQLLGVPLLVPLAWTMMAYPTLLAGRLLAGARSWAAPLLAAWALASWDLFLDPQMVAAGHWTWAFPDPGLPGVDGIPLTNFAGWLAVAFLLQVGLHVLLPAAPGPRAAGGTVPFVLLAWTWLGSTLANAVFFDRPGVAAWGFVAMGLVAGPALAAWSRGRRA
jgi:putative membrane protein